MRVYILEDEAELRHSVELLARHYKLEDRIAAETTGDPLTREDEITGVKSMRLKIEREVAEYLAKKYNLIPQATAQAETEAVEAVTDKAA